MDILKKLNLIPRSIQLVLAFLAGIILVLLLVANPLANSIVSNKLNSKLNGNIDINVEEVQINVFSGDLNIKEITVFQLNEQDTSNKSKNFDFKAKKIIVKDFSILKFLLSKKIKSDSIAVFNPEFRLLQFKKDTGNNESQGLKLNGIFLRKFAIINGEFSKIDSESNEELLYVHDLSFNLLNFHLPKDSVISLKTIRFDNIEMASSKFKLVKHKALYGYAADSLFISTREKKIEIRDCAIIPQYSKYKFAKVVGMEAARVDCKIPRIEFIDFNIDAFLKYDSLLIKKAIVDSFQLAIFKDKRVSRPKNLPEIPLPQQILQDLNIHIKIDTILCSTGSIAFESRSPGSKQTGKLNISKTDITITNICNIKDEVSKLKDMKIVFRGFLMGQGIMNAGFYIPLYDMKKPMTYSGQISKMDLRKLNPFLRHSLFLKIRSGKLNKLTFNASAYNSKAKGDLKIYYSGLKVSVQKFNNKELSENASLEWLLNLLVNSFLIKKDNPSKKKDLRVGKIDFERDKTRMVVHYWLNSILSGVTESLGVPPKLKEKTGK